MKLIDTRWLAAASALVLMACDGGASAVPARDHTAGPPPPSSMAGPVPADDPRDAPIPQVDGKPMWSANRRMTAQENAARHFERNGEAFGAASVEQYVEKAHAFVGAPPKGALTMKRPNGDRLIYDPRSNVFAVATREGAPRIMFKPDDGMAYWERQKAKEATRADRPRRDDAA